MDRAGELGEQAVAQQLDDPPRVLRDLRLDQVLAMRPQVLGGAAWSLPTRRL